MPRPEGARHQSSLCFAVPQGARGQRAHGYDVVDHNAFNPELGGEEAFSTCPKRSPPPTSGSFSISCPTTWAFTTPITPWLDVLEWGPKSPYAASFDIGRRCLRPRGGVLIPILGSSYGEALEAGEIELQYDAARAASPSGITSIGCPSGPAVTVRSCGKSWRRLTPARSLLVALLELRRAIAVRTILRVRRRRPLRLHCIDQADGKDVIERGCRPTGCHGRTPFSRCTTCSSASIIGSRTGGLPAAISTTGDFSTSTRWRCGSKTPAPSAIHGLVRRLIANGRLQGLRLFDHRRPARSAPVFPPAATAHRCERRPGSGPFYVVVENSADGDICRACRGCRHDRL